MVFSSFSKAMDHKVAASVWTGSDIWQVHDGPPGPSWM